MRNVQREADAWRTDDAVERVLARARFASAIGLIGLILGCLAASSIHALMQPLLHLVAGIVP